MDKERSVDKTSWNKDRAMKEWHGKLYPKIKKLVDKNVDKSLLDLTRFDAQSSDFKTSHKLCKM